MFDEGRVAAEPSAADVAEDGLARRGVRARLGGERFAQALQCSCHAPILRQIRNEEHRSL